MKGNDLLWWMLEGFQLQLTGGEGEGEPAGRAAAFAFNRGIQVATKVDDDRAALALAARLQAQLEQPRP